MKHAICLKTQWSLVGLSVILAVNVMAQNDLEIRGYLEAAYDRKSTIEGMAEPRCSDGVKIIAKAQNHSKHGTKEGISTALEMAEFYVNSSSSSWESDILRLSMAFNHAANGDFKMAAERAEVALREVDFNRLQTASNVALEWMREKFGKEHFSRSTRDYMHRIAASYYMDYAEPRMFAKAREHLELLGEAKLREMLLRQLGHRLKDPGLFAGQGRSGNDGIVTRSDILSPPASVAGENFQIITWVAVATLLLGAGGIWWRLATGAGRK